MPLSKINIAIEKFLRRGDQNIQHERYYYTSNKLFEQSLDIYRPVVASSSSKSEKEMTKEDKMLSLSSSSPRDSTDHRPLVVALVVGSGWTGHRSIIYSQTDWWNSSGPKAVANLGHVCVCIRHRGSFPKLSSILTILFVVIMIAILTFLVSTVLEGMLLEERVAKRFTIVFVPILALSLVIVELAGYGSASFEDMQHDVMDALVWLDANKERLKLTSQIDEKVSTLSCKQARPLFIFGGYSSGGHTAATVTQYPKLWKDRNLPAPNLFCDALLYISPVLSTKPYHDLDLYRGSSHSSNTLPSLSRTSSLSSTHATSTKASSASLSSIAMEDSSMTLTSESKNAYLLSLSSPPQWLTNQVVKAAFGDAAKSIPSPIHTYRDSPSIPHIFLGCENEMFGLNWLDIFFCSEVYNYLLKDIGIDSRYTSVRSDHWSILNSDELSMALDQELRLVANKCMEKRS